MVQINMSAHMIQHRLRLHEEQQAQEYAAASAAHDELLLEARLSQDAQDEA